MSKHAGAMSMDIQLTSGPLSIAIDTGHGSGYANEAGKLRTPRKIEISGAVSGEAMFDGSADVNISTSPSAELLTDSDALTTAEIDAIISDTSQTEG